MLNCRGLFVFFVFFVRDCVTPIIGKYRCMHVSLVERLVALLFIVVLVVVDVDTVTFGKNDCMCRVWSHACILNI